MHFLFCSHGKKFVGGLKKVFYCRYCYLVNQEWNDRMLIIIYLSREEWLECIIWIQASLFLVLFSCEGTIDLSSMFACDRFMTMLKSTRPIWLISEASHLDRGMSNVHSVYCDNFMALHNWLYIMPLMTGSHLRMTTDSQNCTIWIV